MYCAWRIPAHLRCTHCSILLHLMDICFLTCICLWPISQIQTFLLKVVGPGLVSTSPAFVSSSASHPAGPHGRHAQKTVNRAPIAGSTQFAQQLESAVTAPPLVGCVVWSHVIIFFNAIINHIHKQSVMMGNRHNILAAYKFRITSPRMPASTVKYSKDNRGLTITLSSRAIVLAMAEIFHNC